MNVVKIYGKTNCTWCKDAKKLAEQYNLKYEYIDVSYADAMKELKELLPDVKTVPQIWWHGNYIGGYQDFVQEIENTLGGFTEQKF
jgi:glutaredoxin